MGIIRSGGETGRLGWSVYANIDLAQFIISGGDFSDPALQDNMFHISLWYDPQAQTSSAWANSGDRAEALSSAANIVDIVFDPKNTGTSMVYVSFAPLALMNDSVIDMINKVSNDHYEAIASSFEGYSMLQLDINAVVSSMAFDQGETSEAFNALGGAIGFASRLLSIVTISGGTGVMNIGDLADVLDGDFGDDPFEMGFSLGDITKALFSAGGEPSDSLQFSLTEYELFGSAATEHNAVSGGLVYNFDGTKKEYLDHYQSNDVDDAPVMTPHIQGTTDENGRFFISLYTQSLPNGVEYTVYDRSVAEGNLNKFSANEAEAISEFAIGYTYTDIYGNLNENIYTARIVRIEGYDPSVTGPQQVTIYTEPVEGYNILTGFDNMLRAYTEHSISFEGYRITAWIDVNAEIQSLSGAAAYSDSYVTANSANTDEVFTIEAGSRVLVSSQFYASKAYEVVITYADGSSKTVGIDARADEFTFSEPSLVSYEKKYVTLGYNMIWTANSAGSTDLILSTPLGELVWHIQITSAG